MRRIVMLIVAAVLCFALTACTGSYQGSIFEQIAEIDSADTADEPTWESTPKQTPEAVPIPESAAEPVPTQEPTAKPEPAEELPWLPEPKENPGTASPETILFIDPDIDVFIMVSIPDWTYATQLREVFFYPANDNSGDTGMAISSHDKSLNTIEMIWRDITEAMEEYFSDYEWEQGDSILTGEYTAVHYNFTAEGFIGDYFLWYSKTKLYICSFTALEGEYNELYPLVVESLGTFAAVSEMND